MEEQVTGYEKADLLQLAVARHYERERGASLVAVGPSPKWDIKFQDGWTLEIKMDVAARRTFNGCVEYWNLKKNCPSGILATSADAWLHCVREGKGLRCYELDTKKLLRLCIESGSVRNGGDAGSSCFKLIPLSAIAEAANRDFMLDGELVELVLETFA